MGYAHSSSIVAICFLVFILIGSTSSQNTKCPFDFMYHLGDGVFDNGNGIATLPYGPRLPAASTPYGETYPGRPTGRWCDGLLDVDYGAQGLGFQEPTTAYLSGNATSASAIMFAVARSPVLDRSFFTARNIKIPPYAASLSIQMSWFRKYLTTVCATPEECADKLANSLFIFGDVEANDITFALIQGKSMQEAQSYVRYVTEAQITAAREVIKMGATRVILPGNAPIGCYPFVLTELATNGSTAYDEIGCLKSVNDLIVFKNNDLQEAIKKLGGEFPGIVIYYADFYYTELSLIQEIANSGTNANFTLTACCGAGGKYNYDNTNFCGSYEVPICSNPNQYFFWDGIHLTQEANRRLSTVLLKAALTVLNCTVSQL